MDKRILKRYEDVYFVLAVILIYFLNAWDFQGFYDDSTKLDLISLPGFDPHNAKYIEKIRLTTFFLKYILKIGYWGFFAFLILFVISFLYVCKKLDVKRIYIYLSLLTLPTLRYGVWDYGVNATDGFVYLIMIWMYYFYRIENYKMYYIFTIIGIFTREFCLYVNLFFLIESFFENCSYNLKEIWSKRKNISKVLNERKFEILAISGYLIYRLFFTLTAETNPLTYGSFRGEGLVSALMDIKNLFILITALGFLPFYLIQQKHIKYLMLLLVVLVPSTIIGLIWEVNKLGCLFVIYVPEFFSNLLNNQKKEKE